MPAGLRQGQILWAEVPDPQGGNVKCRPVVLLTDTADIKPGEKIVVVAATTQFNYPLSDLSVELPSGDEMRPHPVTKLKKRCIVLCDWLVAIEQSQIRSIGGQVPGRHWHEIYATCSPYLATIDVDPPPDDEE